MNDLSPIQQAVAILADIDVRSRSTGFGSAMMNARLNGVSLGHARFRSVVEEEDRVKFYGHRFFLFDSMVTETTPLQSGHGVVYGVRMTTSCGTIDIECPPGLRYRRPR